VRGTKEKERRKEIGIRTWRKFQRRETLGPAGSATAPAARQVEAPRWQLTRAAELEALCSSSMLTPRRRFFAMARDVHGAGLRCAPHEAAAHAFASVEMAGVTPAPRRRHARCRHACRGTWT
jgi:hypothetical protein